jgi:DNA helicase-2/ATP-dependent DNA helicase PcrA
LISDRAKSLAVPEYRVLQLVAGSPNEETQPAFGSRVTKVLDGFLKLIDGFRSRSRELNMAELFDLVVEGTGYKAYLLSQPDGEERWENVLELRTVAQEYRDLKPPDGLAAFLEGVSLVSDVDGLDERMSAVTLITLHQAKGLEFPVVFIVGMEEGILPHFRSMDDPDEMEEERRLCYVGITRAKRKVYLVRAFRRSLMGGSNANPPSRFLKDIPPGLLSGTSLWSVEEDRLAASVYSWNRPPTVRVDTPELKAGDHVRHAQFGDGVVVSCQTVKDDHEVVVAFNGAGLKKLLVGLARLEKVA